jgi:hypothetical protein
LLTSETREIETSYKELMENVSKMIDKIISRISNSYILFKIINYYLWLYYLITGNNRGGAEEELSYETLIGVSNIYYYI